MIKSNQNKYDFLTNFITEEKYLQNPPLETNKFIEFCRIRGIETDRKELEYFEKEKVLFPICRIDLPFIKEEHCLVDKDGNKIKKHIIRYSYHGFQTHDKKLLSEFLKKGNLYDVLKKPFKDWACFKDDTGREKTLSFYSSFQIYWLSILKKAFSANVQFVGDCIKIISYLPVKYELNKGQFSISKNQSNYICSEIKKMSQEKTYEKYFNLKKKIEEVRKEYQKYCKILKFLLNIQNPYYLYVKYALKAMTISGGQEKWIQLKKGFKLDNELKNLGIQIDDIVEWYWAFSIRSMNILGASKGDWTQLWKNMSWNKKEELEGKTRLGIDYLQWAIMLKRAIEDYLGREILDIDELDKHKWDDILKEKTNRWGGRRGSLRSIRNERYLDISIEDGKELRSVYNKILKSDKNKIEFEEAFQDFKKRGFYIDWQDKAICFGKNLNIKNYYHDKYKRLLYLLNSFDLDCQAKVIVFVEGRSEEKILPKIFQWHFGILPDRYGIEFMNFRGVSQLLSTSKNATELRKLIKNIQKESRKQILSEKNGERLNTIMREELRA